MPNDDEIEIPLPAQPFDWIPHLVIGDRVSVKIGDTLYTDVVTECSVMAVPVVIPAGFTLTRWQRLSRRLTPRCWRKPIPLAWGGQTPTMTIKIGE